MLALHSSRKHILISKLHIEQTTYIASNFTLDGDMFVEQRGASGLIQTGPAYELGSFILEKAVYL